MTISLTYFDFDGSRGLECRLALTAAGVDFEDVRIARGQWPGLKPEVPFGGLPVLTAHGRRLPQCNAILAFVGRGHGLHPADAWTAAEHEAIMQSVEDLRHKMPTGRGQSEDEKKAAREAFAAGWLRQWATSVSGHIDGPFLEGEALNVADIKLYVILRSYLAGVYDHIPPTVFDDFPALKSLHAAVNAHPAVRGWFDEG